jgi:N-acetylmuramoyl-L-alanine amidase
MKGPDEEELVMETKGSAVRPPRRRLRPVPAAAPVAPLLPEADPGAAAGTGGAEEDACRLALCLDALARTVEDCPVEAVAAMVMNRLAAGGGEALPGVLDGLAAELGAVPVPAAAGRADLAFATRLRIARRALAGVLDDPTGGATRCRHAGRADGPEGPCLRIGSLVFHRG